MREFKGTTGNWYLGEPKPVEAIPSAKTVDVRAERGYIIGKIYAAHLSPGMANANLMSAAPELFELAKMVEHHFIVVSETQEKVFEPWEVEMWETAENALNKALGQ